MIRLLFGLLLAVVLTLGGWLTPIAPAYANSEPMFLAALPGLSGFFAGQRPTNLGVKAGKLAPCPNSPNCVVSQGAQNGENAIAPIPFTTDPATALATLKTVVKSQPRTEIIQASDDYLYAEFSSQLMGFVDDVEFYIDPAESVIHVRSASRMGQSDLGVNRKRIETLRAEFTAAQA
ncbi:DUF1499 domain-containing protein [Pseudanabaena sp. FACHB-2040]|uniref:DUF1499 domain-containing protein n=1 Tax=Pseudanabaena sp. FACHB-2040 TaxID=2692859 RepID=UPI001689692F|nr:DUF1499 domain-containing protein [Pseudanabaena sp. FACHB-2040]MBD0268863.1 DUF1499 domain-containing protein [Cyanobacteria bacterium Co-bin8]MBD2260722.1 DUF1499 domain-containing protein [Pseudanabaena sp. FACHB-2040]